MKDLTTMFNFEGTEVIILVDNEGIEWFCAKHICDCLELENVSKALNVIEDNDDKIKLENLKLNHDITTSYIKNKQLKANSFFFFWLRENNVYEL